MKIRLDWLTAWLVISSLALAIVATADERDDAKRNPKGQKQKAFTADALASLKRSASFLARKKAYRFGAELTFDVLQTNGQMLEFGGSRDVLIRRPDRLRIEGERRDGTTMQLFFDGQSILIDHPTEDAYVKVEMPGTIYAAIDYLVDDLHTPSPLEDFMSENYAANVVNKIESGFYVQHAQLGDMVCEQLAFRTAEIDLQIWIQAGDEPLPCRVVIRYRHAEGQPQFTAQFRDWNLTPDTDDEMFIFTPPKSAERIQVQAMARELREMGK
jgi:hypothetical protein